MRRFCTAKSIPIFFSHKPDDSFFAYSMFEILTSCLTNNGVNFEELDPDVSFYDQC